MRCIYAAHGPERENKQCTGILLIIQKRQNILCLQYRKKYYRCKKKRRIKATQEDVCRIRVKSVLQQGRNTHSSGQNVISIIINRKKYRWENVCRIRDKSAWPI